MHQLFECFYFLNKYQLKKNATQSKNQSKSKFVRPKVTSNPLLSSIKMIENTKNSIQKKISKPKGKPKAKPKDDSQSKKIQSKQPQAIEEEKEHEEGMDFIFKK